MGKKDASATRLPVEQYRKQIGESSFRKVICNHSRNNIWYCQAISHFNIV